MKQSVSPVVATIVIVVVVVVLAAGGWYYLSKQSAPANIEKVELQIPDWAKDKQGPPVPTATIGGGGSSKRPVGR